MVRLSLKTAPQELPRVLIAVGLRHRVIRYISVALSANLHGAVQIAWAVENQASATDIRQSGSGHSARRIPWITLSHARSLRAHSTIGLAPFGSTSRSLEACIANPLLVQSLELRECGILDVFPRRGAFQCCSSSQRQGNREIPAIGHNLHHRGSGRWWRATLSLE